MLTLLEDKVDGLVNSIDDDSSERGIEDLRHQTEQLREVNVSLQTELAELKEALQVDEKTEAKEDSPAQQSVEHRLFAYLKNKGQREKIEQLVTDTLNRDMSYAQVIDYLHRQTSGKTREVIAAHPKLAKNYIKYRRDNG
jgi:regulator of replication initiation timing